MDVDGLLARGQRLLAPAEVGEAVAEVVQATGEVGEEGVGPRRGQPPVDVDGLLARGQRLLAAAQVGEAMPRLFSDMARSGRKASGRAAASWR